jgi:predicted Zn-dependent peptidase
VIFATAVAALFAAPLAVAELRLDDGVRVVLAPDPWASSVVVHVRRGGGVAAEPADCGGCAFAFARLLAMPELDARVDAIGGWSSTSSAADHVAAIVSVPPGALAFALWLESERVTRASDAAQLARAIGELDAARRGDAALVAIDDALRDALWVGDPYGRSPRGDNGLPSAAALSAYARAQLAPGNTIVVVAGRFERARGEELARKYLGALPVGVAATMPVTTAIVPRARIERLVASPIGRVVFGFRVAPTDYDAAAIVGQILAGGRASQLARRLVATGLASDVRVELDRRARGGELRLIVTAEAGVDPGRLVRPIDAAIGRVRESIEADELARAIATLDAELVTAFEGLAFRAVQLARWVALDGRADGFDAARRRIHDASAELVRSGAERWLDNAVVVVGRP